MGETAKRGYCIARSGTADISMVLIEMQNTKIVQTTGILPLTIERSCLPNLPFGWSDPTIVCQLA
jgi:hypothetical protein